MPLILFKTKLPCVLVTGTSGILPPVLAGPVYFSSPTLQTEHGVSDLVLFGYDPALVVTDVDPPNPPEITVTDEFSPYPGEPVTQEEHLLNWAITGGADMALFNLHDPSVDGARIGLSFNTPPDYDNPIDANADNIYELILTLTNPTTLATTIVPITIEVVPLSAPPLALLDRSGSALLDRTGFILESRV